MDVHVCARDAVSGELGAVIVVEGGVRGMEGEDSGFEFKLNSAVVSFGVTTIEVES